MLDGGVGVDGVFYYGSDAGVSVNLRSGTSSGGYAEGDTLVSIENLSGSHFDDILVGNVENNLLRGGSGNDHIYGGEGNDTIAGDKGYDVLEGGEGHDEFQFYQSQISEVDIITDFGDGDDFIHFFQMKTEDIRIASGHGEAIRQNDYGDSTVEDAILYRTHGTADTADDTAFAILIDYKGGLYFMGWSEKNEFWFFSSRQHNHHVKH